MVPELNRSLSTHTGSVPVTTARPISHAALEPWLSASQAVKERKERKKVLYKYIPDVCRAVYGVLDSALDRGRATDGTDTRLSKRPRVGDYSEGQVHNHQDNPTRTGTLRVRRLRGHPQQFIGFRFWRWLGGYERAARPCAETFLRACLRLRCCS